MVLSVLILPHPLLQQQLLYLLTHLVGQRAKKLDRLRTEGAVRVAAVVDSALQPLDERVQRQSLPRSLG